jgi:hypothetical protein
MTSPFQAILSGKGSKSVLRMSCGLRSHTSEIRAPRHSGQPRWRLSEQQTSSDTIFDSLENHNL